MVDRRRARDATTVRAVRDATTLRASAALVALGAFGVGVGLGRSRPGRGVVRGVAIATALGGIALAAVGRSRIEPGATRPQPAGGAAIDRLHVLIPARDEAEVIGDAIADLGRQDGPIAFDLSIVNDRSTDGTGVAVRAAIEAARIADRAVVIDRTAGAEGKAAALAAVPGIEPRPGTVLLVLDADARIDPTFVARCRAEMSAASAISARRHVLRPRGAGRWARFLSDAQASEQAADDVVQRGRNRLGGGSELRGNGMAIRADVLAGLGGWPEGSLAEDLVLSSRLYLRTGHGARRPPGLEISEQAPTTLRTMFTQRLRWAEGSIRRDLDIVAPALFDRAIPLRRRADVAVSSAQDVMPWVALGVLIGAKSRRRWSLAAEIPIGYAAAVLALALAAPEPGIATGRRGAGLMALGIGWAAILPVAWVRVALSSGGATFRQTPHLPGTDVEPPPFAAQRDAADGRAEDLTARANDETADRAVILRRGG